MEELISAISTPYGTGGVAIVRVSGDGALKLAAQMFTPSGKVGVEQFTPNVMYTGYIQCEGFADFGMCVYFAPPKSFTGGEVVEFHCHGGAQISRAVLARTRELGARVAERGEFTKRAFIAGKLSLSSAEGMVSMINAESLAQLRAGSLLYGEKLNADVTAVRSRLTDLLASIAADTDYPEEGIEKDELADVAGTLNAINAEITKLVQEYSVGKLIKSGVLVAICGEPNVGKSSLLNAFLGYDKAIVSSIAGTTRDAVEGAIMINDVKFHLTDTAGIRHTAGEVESIGIEKAKQILKSADIVLCLSDRGEFSAAGGIENDRLIKIFSKADEVTPFGNFDIAVSSKTGEGLESLKEMIVKKSLGGKSLDSAYVIEERHYECLKRASGWLTEAEQNSASYPPDVIAMDIKEAWSALGEITGDTANEEIINTVFAKFCVGK